ncbi:MAG TPA: beta-ketoacyl-ACP synthase III [Byssovorax sp.]|jgi:3-oxoacyl-[acyl-carrier-protein] synthase-3
MPRETITPRTRILGTGRYAPARVVTNAEIEARVDTTDGWIRQHTGIERRHVLGPGEVTSDMAAAAGRAAIEASGLSVADLDMVILATTTGDSPMPATAVHVQQKLGADLIPAFDINASFAGFLYAMTIADQFIATGTSKTILVVGADAMTSVVDPSDRATAALFGDGAGAVVLGPATGDGAGILASRIHADGTMSRVMRVPGGGSAEPLTDDRIAKRRNTIEVDGQELFHITVRTLTSYSMQALKAAGLTSAELDWVVPHQANRNILERIQQRIGYPRAKFIENLSEYGNIGAGSIPFALDEAVRDGRVKAGQSLLFCALGAGLAWGASIVRM